MFCDHCGKKLRDGIKFCPNCGTPIGGLSEPAAEEVKEEALQEPVAEEVKEEALQEPAVEEVKEEALQEPVAEEVKEEALQEPVAEEVAETDSANEEAAVGAESVQAEVVEQDVAAMPEQNYDVVPGMGAEQQRAAAPVFNVDAAKERVSGAVDQIKGKTGGLMKDPRAKKWLPIAGVAVAALICILLIASNAKKTFNLDKYLETELSGVQGYGSIYADFKPELEDELTKHIAKRIRKMSKRDFKKLSRELAADAGGYDSYEELKEDVGESIDNEDWEEAWEEHREAVKDAESLESYASVYVSEIEPVADAEEASNLSNGDEVTVRYEYNNELAGLFGIRFRGDETKVKVEGLEDVPKFDAFAGIDLIFEGVDGSGTASLDDYESYEYGLEYDVSPRENLSNGDTVTVTVRFENGEDAFINSNQRVPETMSKEYTVEGLTDKSSLKELDWFGNLEITPSGESGDGSISYEDDNPTILGLYIDCDKQSELSNGDKVTFTVEFDETALANEGYRIENATHEYVVEGLKEYVTEFAQIQKDCIDKMEREARETFDSIRSKWKEGAEMLDMKLANQYLLVKKPGDRSGAQNIFYLLYEIKVKNPTDGEQTYYWWARFTNVEIMDGDNYVDTSKKETPKGDNYFSLAGYAFEFTPDSDYYYIGHKTEDDFQKEEITPLKEHYEVKNLNESAKQPTEAPAQATEAPAQPSQGAEQSDAAAPAEGDAAEGSEVAA